MLVLFLSCSTQTEESKLEETTTSQPNIIFFLIDDLGWADLACYGSQFHETPNIDALASEGMRFTNAYAASAVCSPTRASIMTGKYPARLKITDWIPGVIFPQAKMTTPKIMYELPLEETTLAESLRSAGYETWHVGKWHLGEDQEYWPLQQGFDKNIAGHSKGAPGSYFHPYQKKTEVTDWTVRNLPPGGNEGDYLTDRLTDEAIKLMRMQAKPDQPFFLYMSYYAVHTPLEGKADYIEKYDQKKSQLGLERENTTYAAMVQSVDESVGRILAALDSLSEKENTIVMLFSDNGGLVEYNGNAPLREGKGFYYEGGIREPLIVRYPSKVPPGTINDQVVSSIDFYPTLLRLAGTASKEIVDGMDLWPILSDPTSKLNERSLFWHYPHYHTPTRPPTGAMRKGDYKLVEFFEDQRVELYNLKDDISEQHDLAAGMPDKVFELKELLQQWRSEVKADLPIENPDQDPTALFENNFAAWNQENRIK
ncbi:MAG: sulfatase [Cyclobacteriaceae bacterium]